VKESRLRLARSDRIVRVPSSNVLALNAGINAIPRLARAGSCDAWRHRTCEQGARGDGGPHEEGRRCPCSTKRGAHHCCRKEGRFSVKHFSRRSTRQADMTWKPTTEPYFIEKLTWWPLDRHVACGRLGVAGRGGGDAQTKSGTTVKARFTWINIRLTLSTYSIMSGGWLDEWALTRYHLCILEVMSRTTCCLPSSVDASLPRTGLRRPCCLRSCDYTGQTPQSSQCIVCKHFLQHCVTLTHCSSASRGTIHGLCIIDTCSYNCAAAVTLDRPGGVMTEDRRRAAWRRRCRRVRASLEPRCFM
jgi:hypothetical protein